MQILYSLRFKTSFFIIDLGIPACAGMT